MSVYNNKYEFLVVSIYVCVCLYFGFMKFVCIFDVVPAKWWQVQVQVHHIVKHIAVETHNLQHTAYITELHSCVCVHCAAGEAVNGA